MGDTQDSDPNPVTADQPDDATNPIADSSEPQSAAESPSEPVIESPSEPLISKKAQDDVDEGERSPVVYDPDDGLDFESNMGKVAIALPKMCVDFAWQMMVPMVIVFLSSGWVG